MEIRIEQLQEKKCIGMHLELSLANNRTAELWRQFMARRSEIVNPMSSDLYSIQLYPSSYFQNFNPTQVFDKWACCEVPNFDTLPDGMEQLSIPAGLYAVFCYKGSSSDTRIFSYIFSEWIPQSMYELADRPHFEVLGAKYKNNDPTSEEEIWIPIQTKK